MGEKNTDYGMYRTVWLHEVTRGQKFPDTGQGHCLDCAEDIRMGG